MRELFNFFSEFIDQMTLGSNKTLIFSAFKKNETKKRKTNEEMNGLLREDNLQTIGFAHIDNERVDPNSYETPSKRSRIEVEPIMSSDVNTNRQQRRGIGAKAYHFFAKKWEQTKGLLGNNNNNQMDTNLEDVPTVCNTVTEVIPSSSGVNLSHAMRSNTTSNQTISSIDTSIGQPSREVPKFFSIGKWAPTRKRRIKAYQSLDEKTKYKALLNRHLSSQIIITPNLRRKEESHPIIDLTVSDKSMVSSNNNAMKTSEQTFKTEKLDNSSKVKLVDRIKSKGVVAPVLMGPTTNTSRPPIFASLHERYNQFRIFSSKHSTPKPNLFDQNLTQNVCKTPEPVSEKSVSTPLLPESSKKFNELTETNRDFFGQDFVADLRSSLLKRNESDAQKISKSQTLLKECQIKRQTDVQTLGSNFRTPITRTELLPYIPFISIDDKLEEEEEEEEDEEETVPTDFPELTLDMNKEIDSALKCTPPNEVLSEGFTMQICRKDMETLRGLNWLNDEIINFYLSLIVERGKNDNFPTVYAFNTFFYKKLRDNGPQSLKRWTRKVDVFANDFIFIPIHLGMHWCLAVIDFINKRIEYYDSMGGSNMECIQALKGWLQAESLDKKKCEYPMTDWILQMVKDIPQQMNGSDCGMFSIKYAEYISRKAKINFSQAHMPYFRRRMVYEILTKQLL